jgi:hypothetical protein
VTRALERFELNLAEVILRTAIGALGAWRRLAGRAVP